MNMHWFVQFTSDKGVVKNHEAYEDVIKHGKCNKKSVEGVFHDPAWQNYDRDGVADQSKQTNRQLKQKKAVLQHTKADNFSSR